MNDPGQSAGATLGYAPPRDVMRHSTLAIAAFAATMLAPLGLGALVVLYTTGWIAPSPLLRLALVGMLVGGPVVGFTLAATDLVLPRRRRVLAAVALFLSGVILLLYLLVIFPRT